MGICVSSSGAWKLIESKTERRCKICKSVWSSGTCTCYFLGSCSCPRNASPSPSCVLYSPRIQGLREGHRTEEATAQDHWTMVDPVSETEVERVVEENRKYFEEVLVNHPEWGVFFTRFGDLEILNEKIGEGGQAEIFNATSQSYMNRYGNTEQLVAKVWKAGVSLKDLQRQWPRQIMCKGVLYEYDDWPFRNIKGAAFIRDGEFKNRFAFVMVRRWRDLRTHIDRQMHRQNSHGPPFKVILDVYKLILEVANDLRRMHAVGVLHRDVKASNVLLGRPRVARGKPLPYVIDFECSLGVSGTGFWRAPEILDQLRKRVPSHEVVFAKEADVYSFGMLCYEIITGRIPFEGHPLNDYSIVLRGERPGLPHDLAAWLKELVNDCWQHDPQLRPTALQIYERLKLLTELPSISYPVCV